MASYTSVKKKVQNYLKNGIAVVFFFENLIKKISSFRKKMPRSPSFTYRWGNFYNKRMLRS